MGIWKDRVKRITFPKVGGHYPFRGGAGRTKRHRKGKLALSWAGTSIFSCPQTLAFLVLRTLDLGCITQLAFLVLKLVVGRWRDVSMTRTHNYRGQEIPYTCQDSAEKQKQLDIYISYWAMYPMSSVFWRTLTNTPVKGTTYCLAVFTGVFPTRSCASFIIAFLVSSIVPGTWQALIVCLMRRMTEMICWIKYQESIASPITSKVDGLILSLFTLILARIITPICWDLCVFWQSDLIWWILQSQILHFQLSHWFHKGINMSRSEPWERALSISLYFDINSLTNYFHISPAYLST